MLNLKNSKLNIITKNVNSLFLIQFFSAGIGFLTTAQIGKVLGPDNFGYYSYILSLGAYGSIIMQYGIDKTLTRDLVHGKNKGEQILVTSIILKIIFFIFLFILLISTSKIIFKDENIILSNIIIISFLLGSFGLGHFFDIKEITYIHSFITFFHKSIYFGILWWFFIYHQESISLLIIAIVMIITSSIGLIYEYFYLRSFIFIKLKNIYVNLKIIITRNFQIWITEIIGLSLIYLNKIFLITFASETDLGHFQASWTITMIGTLFISQIIRVGNVYLSKITKKNCLLEIRKFLKLYLFSVFLIGIIFYLALLFSSNFLILFFFGEEYFESIEILKIASLYILVFGVYTVCLQYLMNIYQSNLYTSFIVLISVLSIILNLIFIPLYGNIGAAWALPISVLSGLPLLIFVVFKADIKKRVEFVE